MTEVHFVAAFDAAVANLLHGTQQLLTDLIRIPSVSGTEEPAVRHLAKACTERGLSSQLRSIPNTVRDDRDYSFAEAGIAYEERHNLVVRLPGPSRSSEIAHSLILQTHLDVVPAEDWASAFEPTVDGDAVIGRGACDCKGQAALAVLVLQALADIGFEPGGDIAAQFVVEEEIGGNGALSMILDGDRADGVIVLEATEMNVHPANRGAVWFRIGLQGVPVHMGRKQDGVSAFEMAIEVAEALHTYEAELVAQSRGQPLFERYERPVQVNVGTVRAGEWPSMVPGECTIEGGVGFLPNKPMQAVQGDLRRLLASHPNPRIRRHHTIDFPKLHNDAYAIDPIHPLVTTLADSAIASGIAAEVFGWNVSCDARLYAHRGGMPTVVFGPGSVADAHSTHERILMSDIARAARALGRFVYRWCSAEGPTGAD